MSGYGTMAFEFEALVGHLYVVGGRSISATPPGALVEIAPKRAVRGREMETFFALVLPSGDVTAPTAFYEQMAKLAAERYFNTTGSVTSALRSIFNHLNENLVEHNHISKRHYEANMLCGVLRENDLIIARVGAGVVIARLMGEVKTYPENLSDDDALFGPPLGVQPIPDVKMTRYTVSDGSRLLLADVNLADAALDKLSATLQAPDIAAVLVGLKALALKQVTVMAVEFVPPDVPAPLPVKEGRSTAEIAAPKTTTAELTRATGEAPAAARRERRKPLDEATQKFQVQLQQGAGAAALQTSRAMSTLDKTLERLFPDTTQHQPKRWSSPLTTLVVVLIPVIIVAAVMMMWLGGAGGTEFEQCVNEATSRAQLARSIPSNNRTDTLNAWGLVLAQVEVCDRLRPKDVYLGTLRTEGQAAIDGLNQITRRAAQAIVTVQGEGVIISQLVLQGSDIYALDDTNSIAYRIALSADGKGAAGAAQPINAMRAGGKVGQYNVDRLVGIGFSTQDKVVVGLDRTGLVITCQPRFITQCEGQRLVGAEKWRSPIAIAVWANKLFILDPGADQIWRYEQTAGQYSAAPTDYFTGTGRPSLINAVDFGIDSAGNLYLLRSDGVVTKYFGGQPIDFGYGGFPQAPNGGTALLVNDGAINPGLVIVNRGDRTIYETSLYGTWGTSFRVFDENLFALLSDAAVEPSQRLIYAASGNAILVFERG